MADTSSLTTWALSFKSQNLGNEEETLGELLYYHYELWDKIIDLKTDLKWNEINNSIKEQLHTSLKKLCKEKRNSADKNKCLDNDIRLFDLCDDISEVVNTYFSKQIFFEDSLEERKKSKNRPIRLMQSPLEDKVDISYIAKLISLPYASNIVVCFLPYILTSFLLKKQNWDIKDNFIFKSDITSDDCDLSDLLKERRRLCEKAITKPRNFKQTEDYLKTVYTRMQLFSICAILCRQHEVIWNLNYKIDYEASLAMWLIVENAEYQIPFALDVELPEELEIKRAEEEIPEDAEPIPCQLQTYFFINPTNSEIVNKTEFDASKNNVELDGILLFLRNFLYAMNGLEINLATRKRLKSYYSEENMQAHQVILDFLGPETKIAYNTLIVASKKHNDSYWSDLPWPFSYGKNGKPEIVFSSLSELLICKITIFKKYFEYLKFIKNIDDDKYYQYIKNWEYFENCLQSLQKTSLNEPYWCFNTSLIKLEGASVNVLLSRRLSRHFNLLRGHGITCCRQE